MNAAINNLPVTAIGCEPTAASRKLGSVGSRLLALLVSWHARSQSRYELANLSERQRADMGLDPEFIAAETRKPFWQASSIDSF